MSEPTALRTSHRRRALIAVCLTAAAMPLTFTGTAMILPIIGRELGASAIEIAWVTNAFMLTFGSTLMVMGAIADGSGRRRLFLIGSVAFALVSLMLMFTSDMVIFDWLRAAQGLAAAATLSGGMAALAQLFDGPARLRAFSLIGTSFGAGLSLGPMISGVMAEAFGWHSVFMPVVALAGMAWLIGAHAMGESRNPKAAGLDWPGALSFTAALALFTYAILSVPEHGWSSATAVMPLLAAALLGAGFVWIEHSVRQPILDLSLFRYPRFVGVQLLAAAPAYGFVVLLILLPMRFVGIERMPEVTTGLMMMALSAPLLILPVLSGQLTRWWPPATLCASGLGLTAVGLAGLAMLPLTAPAWATALTMLVIGTGISLPWGLMDGLAVSVVPRERAGMAAGIFSTMRVAGEGVALAVVGAMLSTLIVVSMPDSEGVTTAANLLAVGNLEAARSALPDVDTAELVAHYGYAFSRLLWILAAITLTTAVVLLLTLGRGESGESLDRA
ncbi:MFS transporter [Salinicola endophyticus]|uniref:MFS transporter n=2 Tax=Salinicola endophyticus TaxID=1949083 RepID=A0ABY8FHJ3_9GAMM|nr:MFS transporter [Salinicola endophyticus]